MAKYDDELSVKYQLEIRALKRREAIAAFNDYLPPSFSVTQPMPMRAEPARQEADYTARF